MLHWAETLKTSHYQHFNKNKSYKLKLTRYKYYPENLTNITWFIPILRTDLHNKIVCNFNKCLLSFKNHALTLILSRYMF